jgi:hypothetical protein
VQGFAPDLTHNHETTLERSAREKPSSLLQTFVNYRFKRLYKIVICGTFHKHVTCVTYGPNKISCIIRLLHAEPNIIKLFDVIT